MGIVGLKKRAALVLCVAALALAFGFQNCSPVEFAGNPTLAKGDNTDVDVDGSPTNPGDPTDDDDDTSVDLDRDVPVAACKSVVELQPSSNLVIPARTSDGICFAVKIMNAIPNGASSLTPTVEAKVVSRDHDQGGADTDNPYLMGHSNLTIKLLDARKIKLSGALSSASPIKVDNFVLVGIYPESAGNSVTDPKYFKAYGSKDSVIQGTNHILLDSNPIDFQAFSNSGTSTIAPLELSGSIQLNTNFKLDVRALDCGGIRELTDIYVLFQ